MTFTIGVETRRYATVSVEAESEDEAIAAAENTVIEEPEKADWNAPVVDCCTVLFTAETPCDNSDRAYEERRERAFV